MNNQHLDVILTECCCTEMARARTVGTIVEWSTGTLAIRNTPHMVDDGNGVMDDMSGECPIKFCPFCGSELPHT
jgi:hypothetical protein